MRRASRSSSHTERFLKPDEFLAAVRSLIAFLSESMATTLDPGNLLAISMAYIPEPHPASMMKPLLKDGYFLNALPRTNIMERDQV